MKAKRYAYDSYIASSFSASAGVGQLWNFATSMAIDEGDRWLGVDAHIMSEKPTLESAVIEFVYRY